MPSPTRHGAAMLARANAARRLHALLHPTPQRSASDELLDLAKIRVRTAPKHPAASEAATIGETLSNAFKVRPEGTFKAALALHRRVESGAIDAKGLEPKSNVRLRELLFSSFVQTVRAYDGSLAARLPAALRHMPDL